MAKNEREIVDVSVAIDVMDGATTPKQAARSLLEWLRRYDEPVHYIISYDAGSTEGVIYKYGEEV